MKNEAMNEYGHCKECERILDLVIGFAASAWTKERGCAPDPLAEDEVEQFLGDWLSDCESQSGFTIH